MGPISSVLNAALRRIGFSAPRCSFFRSRHQISSRIRRGREFMLQWGAIAQLVPANWRQFRAQVWRADSDSISVRTLTPEIFPQNLRSVPSEVVGWFSCILLFRFLRRRPSIEISASSFLRFSENSFCRKPYSSRDLTPCVAVVLSVSLLATKTPVLRRSHCVGHATAKPREHGGATDAFLTT